MRVESRTRHSATRRLSARQPHTAVIQQGSNAERQLAEESPLTATRGTVERYGRREKAVARVGGVWRADADGAARCVGVAPRLASCGVHAHITMSMSGRNGSALWNDRTAERESLGGTGRGPARSGGLWQRIFRKLRDTASAKCTPGRCACLPWRVSSCTRGGCGAARACALSQCTTTRCTRRPSRRHHPAN